jgi:gamma-glutamylcyclotransferase (GGCT)/AIG2-like uncharacterized protein YtfP
MMAMRPYFAYGSNMSGAQMALRCPDSHPVGTAWLNNYRFLINERGVASIAICEGRVVHGLVWDISESDERSLDRYEGVAKGFYRKTDLPVVLQGCRSLDALVYIAASDTEGRPRTGYMEKIISAAGTLGFPPDNLEELKAWLVTTGQNA